MPRSLLWSVLVLALPLSGCKSWRVESGVSPAEFVAKEHPERIQVRRTDKTTMELFNPSVVGDSLKGLPTELAIRPVTLPLSDVASVATRHFSLGKSALLVVAVVGGALIYDWLMSLNQGF
jgi:hypothetical protein